jgi:hypothetical protein
MEPTQSSSSSSQNQRWENDSTTSAAGVTADHQAGKRKREGGESNDTDVDRADRMEVSPLAPAAMALASSLQNKVADGIASLAASTAPSSAAHPYTQQATHPTNFRALRTLNSVRLDNVVGAGTFGIVFKAEDIDTGDTVALKKIKFEMKDEKKMMEGFPLTVRRWLN